MGGSGVGAGTGVGRAGVDGSVGTTLSGGTHWGTVGVVGDTLSTLRGDAICSVGGAGVCVALGGWHMLVSRRLGLVGPGCGYR